MNEINLDSLLQIGSPAKLASQLKLDSSQLYQALLQIGRDGQSQLTIQTPQAPIQLSLPANQPGLQLWLAQNVSQALPANQTAAANSPAPLTTLAQTVATQTPLDSSALSKSPVAPGANNSNTVGGKVPLPANVGASQAAINQKVLLQLQPAANGQLKLTMQMPSQLQQLQLTAAQVVNLIQQSRSGGDSSAIATLSSQRDDSSAAATTQSTGNNNRTQAASNNAAGGTTPLLINVQLQRQGQQLLVLLPDQQSMRLDLTKLPRDLQQQLSQLNPLQKLPATLQIGVKANQVQLSLQLAASINRPPATGKADATTSLTTTPLATLQPAARANAPVAGILLQFSPAQVSQLLPELAQKLLPKQLPVVAQQLIIGQQQLPLPNFSAAGSERLSWQLQSPDQAKSWQLQLQTEPKTQSVQLPIQALGKPVQWQVSTQSPAAALLNQPSKADISSLWRQLLPLTGNEADPLLPSPRQSPAVNALLHEVRAQIVDGTKPLLQQQILAQLSAAVQFNPLQSQPNSNTAAGSLALAIQLLLGRLSSSNSADNTRSPARDKMATLVNQLDKSQSSNLLKQLSSHSSQMQSAQLASLEQAAPGAKADQNQLFIHLPLLNQGETRFTELAISEREADGSQDGKTGKLWQLTMKFQLAELGEMLVQVRLAGTDVSFQFYAQSEATLQRTEQFLPLFKDRLKVQGLNVTEVQVQLGKIPEHLYQRGTSLLQVKV